MASDRPRCKHWKLHFGDGGFLLHCADCGQTWEARRRGEPDWAAARVGLTQSDIRLDPDDKRLR